MVKEYKVFIEGQSYTVIISDEKEALLAAKAAGKASVGLWRRDGEQDLSAAGYVIESLEDLDSDYLEQVARRNLELPWIITKTQRLWVREFQPGDEVWMPEEKETEGDRIFRSAELLGEYIRHQYKFYGYGIWAVVEKGSNRIVGKAGLVNAEWDRDIPEGLELGYHIFAPYRRRGFALEACRGILTWFGGRMDCKLYAKTDASNEASAALIKKLGFSVRDRKYIGSGQWRYLYEWNC